MRVRTILPALTEATSPHFRPVKYSLFPPPDTALHARLPGEGRAWTPRRWNPARRAGYGIGP